MSKSFLPKLGLGLLMLGGVAVQVGLVASPALLSIGGGVAAGGGLFAWGFRQNYAQPLPRHLAIGWLLVFGSVVLGIVYGPDLAPWANQLKQKGPILLICLALFGIQSKQIALLVPVWAWAFVCAVALVALHSLLHYFVHKDVIDYWVQHGKEVPVIRLTANPFHYQEGYLSHIYFGVLVAFAAYLSAWLGLHLRANGKHKLAWVGFVTSVFFGIALHLFTSRTGLLAFYAGGALLTLRFVLDRKHRKWVWLALVGAGLLAGGAYFGSSSIRNRVAITLQDLDNLRQGGDLTEWSLGRRYAVYSCAVHVWQEHPWAGVGPVAARDSLLAQYPRESFTVAEPVRLKDPHNQYLEWLVSFGVLGGLLLVGYGMALGLRYGGAAHWLLAVIGVQLAVAMLFESLLERQVGLNFAVWWTLSLALYFSLAPKQNQTE